MPANDKNRLASLARFLLLRGLLFVGIVVNVAFLAINLRPERPHIGSRLHGKVLLRADPPRAKWIKEHQLAPFGAANDIDLDVVTAANWDEVLALLMAEKSQPTGLLLASVADEIVGEVRAAGTIAPMQDVLRRDEVATALDDYLPGAIARSSGSDGRIWFVPKRGELNIAVYRRSALEDAQLHWQEDRAAIDAAIAEANGVGLPRGFVLNASTAEWTSYDLFVAGWYWAHHPAPWASSTGDATLTAPAPRLAWRTGPNGDAAVDLLELFYQHGLTSPRLGQVDAPAVLDALQWMALLTRHHLLAPACATAAGINSDGVNDLFKAGRLAWAPIMQEDSLWLHGGARSDADPGIDRPEDLGWSPLPAGESLEIEGPCPAATKGCRAGEPKRVGRSFAFDSIHYWALPVHSPHPRLAWELARFLTARGPQQRETEAQGMLPVRVDLRDEYPILFRLVWMQEILDASYQQLALGTGPLPEIVAEKNYDDRYAALYKHVVVERSGAAPPTLDAIRAAVRSFHE